MYIPDLNSSKPIERVNNYGKYVSENDSVFEADYNPSIGSGDEKSEVSKFYKRDVSFLERLMSYLD